MRQEACVLIFALPGLVLLLAPPKFEFQALHIEACFCNASKNFIFENYSCASKSYSQAISTVTIIGTSKKPLNDLHVRYDSEK